MRRRLMIFALILCLLGAGAAIYRAGLSASPAGSVTRMAELGLVLLDSENGVSVLAVKEKSPAERAGILPGDVLLQADEVAITDIAQLESILPTVRKNMQLCLQRDQEQQITVYLHIH